MDFEASVEIAAEKSRDVDTEAFHAEAKQYKAPTMKEDFLHYNKVFEDWVFDLFMEASAYDMKGLRESFARISNATSAIDRLTEQGTLGMRFYNIVMKALSEREE